MSCIIPDAGCDLIMGLLSLSINLQQFPFSSAFLCNPNPSRSLTRVKIGSMAGNGPISQDWEPVVLRKKAPTAAAKKDEKAVNAARRSGAEIETIKKFNAGSNKASSSSTSLNTRKLDEETENLTRFLLQSVVGEGLGWTQFGLQGNSILNPKKYVTLEVGDAQKHIDERVSTELKKNLMQARLEKKLTQAQLAQLINEKPQIIQEYESGKAIPNQQIIIKLERVLGTKLRGKK
ncbi:hypothetical protein ZIOFF_053112 [Zingiber officinale]|uniref:HTH cro/C1-type domain-containing protein n=1 Tax=Zingiber officinale TaxID=94328 RepID=A0A8J5FC01_ZINOF|nr:hypothetical protein ZIOFF_053112 [Zingiber officinale]